MQILKQIISILIILLTFNSCKKDCKCQDPSKPECENYDPCYGKIITADFFMHQYDGWFVDPKKEKPENCDTLLSNGAKFNAYMPKANSYQWKVGTDTRVFTGSTLELLFDDYINDFNNLDPSNNKFYKPIPVTLTVKNKFGGCIQAKDTVLKKTRNLVFTNTLNDPLYYGTFKGVSNHDGMQRTIVIYSYNVPFDPFGNTYRLFFKNLPNMLNKDSLIVKNYNTILKSYKYLWWEVGNNKIVSDLSGDNYVDGLNTCKIFIQPRSDGKDYLRIDYKHVSKDNVYQNYVFTGTRIK